MPSTMPLSLVDVQERLTKGKGDVSYSNKSAKRIFLPKGFQSKGYFTDPWPGSVNPD